MLAYLTQPITIANTMEKLGSPDIVVESAHWLVEGYEYIREVEEKTLPLKNGRTAFIKKLLPGDETKLIDTMTTADIGGVLTVTDQLVHARGDRIPLSQWTRLRVGLYLAGEVPRSIADMTECPMSSSNQAHEREFVVEKIWKENMELPQTTRDALLARRHQVLRDYFKELRRQRKGETLPPQPQYTVAQLLEALERSERIDAEERELVERHFMDRSTSLRGAELTCIMPLLEDFQRRAAMRLRLYELDQDSRRPPRGRGAILLGHLIGSNISSVPPISRAELIGWQHPTGTINHEKDDELVAEGLQWLLMKPQP